MCGVYVSGPERKCTKNGKCQINVYPQASESSTLLIYGKVGKKKDFLEIVFFQNI